MAWSGEGDITDGGGLDESGNSFDSDTIDANGDAKRGEIPSLRDYVLYRSDQYSKQLAKQGGPFYKGFELSFDDPNNTSAQSVLAGYKKLVDQFNEEWGAAAPYEATNLQQLAKFNPNSVGAAEQKGSASFLANAIHDPATMAILGFTGATALGGFGGAGSSATSGGTTGFSGNFLAANDALTGWAANPLNPSFVASDVLGNAAVNAATGISGAGLGTAFDPAATFNPASAVGNTTPINFTDTNLLPDAPTPGLDTVDPMANQAPAPVQNGPTNPTAIEKALTQAGMDPANAAKIAQAASMNSLPPGSSSLLSRVLSGNGTASDISSLVGVAKTVAGLVSSATSGSGNVQAGTTAADTAANIALDQWNYYKQNYQPLETSLIKEASEAGSPDEFARARGTANADVTGAFDKAGKQTASRLQSFGINPGAPAYQAAMSSTDLAQGAAAAGAATGADNRTRDLAYAKKLDVASIGKGLPASSVAGLNSSSAAQNNAATTANNLNAQTQRNIGYGLDNLGNLVGKAATWFGGTSDPIREYGGSNVFGGGGTGTIPDEINWDLEFADGGRVGVDPMDPRAQAAYKRAVGDDINANASTKAAAQPVSDGSAQTTLTRQERLERNAKAAAGPTDPKMRAQMGLPPLKGFARGGHVGLDSVLVKRGLSDEMRKRVITPHLRFADGGGVGNQQMGLDDSDMGMPNQVSTTSQPIDGVGTETSDSIPAVIDGQELASLSRNEFVMNAEVPKMNGEEILKAINDAGLRKRQQQGLDTAQRPPTPQTSNQVPINAGAQAYARGGHVKRYTGFGLGA